MIMSGTERVFHVAKVTKSNTWGQQFQYYEEQVYLVSTVV